MGAGGQEEKADEGTVEESKELLQSPGRREAGVVREVLLLLLTEAGAGSLSAPASSATWSWTASATASASCWSR